MIGVLQDPSTNQPSRHFLGIMSLLGISVQPAKPWLLNVGRICWPGGWRSWRHYVPFLVASIYYCTVMGYDGTIIECCGSCSSSKIWVYTTCWSSRPPSLTQNGTRRRNPPCHQSTYSWFDQANSLNRWEQEHLVAPWPLTVCCGNTLSLEQWQYRLSFQDKIPSGLFSVLLLCLEMPAKKSNLQIKIG